MWYTIKEGKHRPFFPTNIGIHFGKTEESYEVIFDESCNYQLNYTDQLDWCKLVGWSYGLHHNNSVRLGWRYNPSMDVIEISRYGYHNGVRTIHPNIETLELGVAYTLVLEPWIEEMKPKWGYDLGIWFGGNNVSPKDMKIWLRKI